MINYSCPNCGTLLASPSSLAGQYDECPVCRSKNVVPFSKSKHLWWVTGVSVALVVGIIACIGSMLTIQKLARGRVEQKSAEGAAIDQSSSGLLTVQPNAQMGKSSSQAGPARTPVADISSLRIHSARLEQTSESLSYPFSGSYRVYTLRLVLENTGRAPMMLADHCALFETTSDGNTYGGVIQTRLPLFPKNGPTLVDMRNRYCVSNVQPIDDAGEGKPVTADIDSQAGAFFMLMTATLEGAKNPSYGTIWPGEHMVLWLKYKLGSGMKPEFLSRVMCFSPIICGAGQSRLPLGAVLSEFTNPDTAGNGNQDRTRWKPSQNSVVQLDFDSLVRRIEDNRSPAVMRVLALNLLADFHGQRAIEVTRTRLSTINEVDGDVRLAAIQILGLLGDRGSIVALMKLLSNDQSESLRRVAALALGNMQAAEAVESLTTCARDKAQSVATAAIEALGKIHCLPAVSALAKLAADPDYAHAGDAVNALRNSGALAVVPLEGALADKRSDVAKAAAASLGEVLQPSDLKKLGGHDPTAEQARARMLRELDPALDAVTSAQALGALEKAMCGPRSEVALFAVDAYTGVPGRRVSGFLLSMADAGKGPLVPVLKALSKRREPDAGTRVLKYLTIATPKEVCEAAISAAVELKLTTAQNSLLELLRKGEESTRAASADALGKLKAENARDSLEAILGDRTQPAQLRWSSLAALKELPGGPHESILLKVATARKDETRWECLDELCESKSEQAQSAVHSALSETDEEGKWRREVLQRRWDGASGKRTLGFGDRLASTSEDDRWGAIREVEEKKDTTAIPVLTRALKNEASPRVLRQLGDTFVALNCHDPDVISAFHKKLDLKDTDALEAAAKSLRDLTGRKIGPYGGESASELAEDVHIWQSCSPNILK